jgi:heme-degrading monooxygenase HmoA
MAPGAARSYRPRFSTKGANMHARIGTWRGNADELERWVERSRGDVVAGVRETPGSMGVLLLLDRAGGEALTITLWEDEGAMRASEERRAALQQGTAHVSGAAVETRRYEVVDAVW